MGRPPSRGAEAMIAAVERDRPPFRLPLGAFAWEAMKAELEAVRKEMEGLEAVARGADFPA